MPNATQDKGTTQPGNDATLTAVATSPELARSNPKPCAPEPLEGTEDPYENAPCTD